MSDTLDALPPEVARLMAPHMAGRDDDVSTLDAIGIEIAQKRDDAKAARLNGLIEQSWKEAEEAYEGIDDSNRHETGEGGRFAKPLSMEGPLTSSRRNRSSDHRSTAFLRLTSRYVDAGAAKLGEILLPADDKSFSFNEMPVPELLEAQDDTSQVVHGDMGVPLTRPVTPGEPPPTPPGQPPQPAQAMPPAPVEGASPPVPPPGAPRVPLTVKDLALEHIAMARKKAKAAETRIYDWLIQCQYRAEIRKVIFDSARLGVGVLKGPVPKTKRVMALIKDEKTGDIKVTIKDKIIPCVCWCDPWNIYPDPACGENVNDGSHILERDHMSARQLRRLKALPGYIASQIDKVLEEGPDKAYHSEGRRGSNTVKQKDRYEIWYFYGVLTKEEFREIDRAAGGKSTNDEDDDSGEEVSCIVTLVNDSVVRATINPLDSGSFPYHSMPWQRRSESWAGVGVAEQMRTPQRVVNASLRALLDNAGKSAGSQLVINQSAIVPADGEWTITPDKLWFLTGDGPVDVRQAMMAIQIPNVTEQMMQIVTLAERFAEETTSIPLITQGQSGATTPDTFGAAQLQNNNANQLLRSIGYSFDDYITEPVIRQFYEWLLLDPDVPNEEKGEYQIDAHGSAALVERAIQDQSIAQMAAMALNPAYGIDPKKWAALFLKSKHLDPEQIQFTKEEQEKMAAMPPPQDPRIAAAQIAADAQIKLGVMKQQSDAQSLQNEQKIADAAHLLEGQKIQVQSTISLHELEQQRQQTLQDYATREKVSTDQAKTQLAKTAMQLAAQRELNRLDMLIEAHKQGQDHKVSLATQAIDTAHENRRHHIDTAVDLHKHRNPSPKPPVQLPGRAGNGKAFSQAP